MLAGAASTGLLLTAGCFATNADVSAEELAAELDDLPIPATWELVETETFGAPCNITETCPQATRRYFAELDAVAAERAVTRLFDAAGIPPDERCAPASTENPVCNVTGEDGQRQLAVLIGPPTSPEAEAAGDRSAVSIILRVP